MGRRPGGARQVVRHSSGTLALQAISLGLPIRGAPAGTDRHVAFEVDAHEDHEILCDPDKIKQLL